MASKIKVVLRNHLNGELIDYDIKPHDHQLSRDWVVALKDLLRGGFVLEKNYCWHGFPNNPRNLQYLCDELNRHIYRLNQPENQYRWLQAGLDSYVIEEYFTPDAVRFPEDYGNGLTEELKQQGVPEAMFLALSLKHNIMNTLHNHFERLQGTVEGLSHYYIWADDDVKWSLRQLNNLCHEIESLVLSQRKAKFDPQWIRPSQITTWLAAPRLKLTAEHRKLFDVNQYDREFGGVYMHWAQIGKTLFEVWRDEGAPNIDKTTCEAITELKYFSGEFDIEWGRSITSRDAPWHALEQTKFKTWLTDQGYNADDNAGLSLGYLPLAQVDVTGSFGGADFHSVINTLGNHLDIHRIEVDDVSATYDYHWSDSDWQQKQIDFLKPGYRYSSRV
jgi:hypothetical protein